MALKVKKFLIEDPSDLFDYDSVAQAIYKKSVTRYPFNDLRFIYACLETTGSNESFAAVVEDQAPLDLIILKNSQGGTFRSCIPPDIPHFNFFQSLTKFPTDTSLSLLSEFKEIFLSRVLLRENEISTLSRAIPGIRFSSSEVHKIRVPDNFERWLYRVKPANHEKFKKLFKYISKEDFKLQKIEEPLAFQEEIELSLGKRLDLPLLTRSLISTLLLQLKLAHLDIYFELLKAENWDLCGAVILEYSGKLYVLGNFDFNPDSKIDHVDLMGLLLLKEASARNLQEIIFVGEVSSSSLPLEPVTVYDIYLKA